MEKSFIEVTMADVMQENVSDVGRRVIGVAHIVAFDEALQNTVRISLASGDHLYVKESYDDLKRMIGM